MVLLKRVLALVVSMIIDLDRPQRGLILASLTPLENVQQQLAHENERAVRTLPPTRH